MHALYQSTPWMACTSSPLKVCIFQHTRTKAEIRSRELATVSSQVQHFAAFRLCCDSFCFACALQLLLQYSACLASANEYFTYPAALNRRYLGEMPIQALICSTACFMTHAVLLRHRQHQEGPASNPSSIGHSKWQPVRLLLSWLCHGLVCQASQLWRKPQ